MLWHQGEVCVVSGGVNYHAWRNTLHTLHLDEISSDHNELDRI
jgi:hypothetical protein